MDFAQVLAKYDAHLSKERGLSPNSVRAYLGDLQSLLSHLETLGLTTIENLDIAHLRSWLANQTGAR